MRSTDPRPFASSRFVVDLGVGDPHSAAGGFSEVILPTLRVDADRTDRADGETIDAPPERLILRRGVLGALDLYTWWDKARRGKAPKRRTVKVSLLGDAFEPVFTWRFLNARPVSLSYSPLFAAESGLLIETIELAYDRVEIG